MDCGEFYSKIWGEGCRAYSGFLLSGWWWDTSVGVLSWTGTWWSRVDDKKVKERAGGRGRERKKERKTRGPKLWWSKGALLAEMQVYISFVRLLSYYTGWNFINSHNMDSLIHTRSLTLKRVTEGSYRKESKQIPFLMISVLSAALLFPGIGTDKKQKILEKQHVGILLLNIPWHQSSAPRILHSA